MAAKKRLLVRESAMKEYVGQQPVVAKSMAIEWLEANFTKAMECHLGKWVAISAVGNPCWGFSSGST